MANSETRCFSLLDSNEIIVGGQAKLYGTKNGLCESTVRKKLGDITNLHKQSRLAAGVDKAQLFPNTDKAQIDKFQKENTSLLKFLTDKDEIIALSDSELQKININMRKLRQQNFQLAQANTLMLAELNAGKDRLKAMQHQLGCTNSLLRVKEMELKELKSNACRQTENQVGTGKTETDVMEIKEADKHQSNQYNNRKPQQTNVHFIVKDKELKKKTEIKRVCLEKQLAIFELGEPETKGEDTVASKEKAQRKRGRQSKSAAFKLQEPKPKQEDGFEITDTAKLSECSSSLDSKEGSIGRSLDGEEFRRPSIARPLRLAAKKVQSYREIPLTVKMRRPE